MRKTLIIAIILILLGMNVAYAQEGASLLPSNPFYFLKEWRRGAQHFFTFNAVKELELELQIIHEKAFEAKRLAEITPENDKALEKAIGNYLESSQRLQDSLNSLPESIRGAKIDLFLSQLAAKSIRHFEIFSDLKQNRPDRNQKGIVQLQQFIGKTLAIVPEKLEDYKQFRERLERILGERESGVFSSVAAARFLGQLAEALPIAGVKEIYKLEEDWLLKIQGQLRADASALDNLTGDPDRLVAVLDGLREQVGDSADLKTKLNLLRQDILDQALSKSVRKPAAEKMILEATRLISGLEEEFRKSPSLARAKFNLEQAEVSFASGQYNAAFGQATGAVAAIKGMLGSVVRTQEDLENDIKKLKSEYDRLAQLAGENSEILELLAKAEKDLIKAADLLSAEKPGLDKINSLLRGVKIILAEVAARLE